MNRKKLDLGDLKIWVFGGWNEIGGNQILLETSGGSLLLDFGKPFGRWGNYFTEFLSPRPTLGLRDLLFLGLLPPIPGLYRDGANDTLFVSHTERGLLEKEPDGGKVSALLLTHAHLDHSGAIAYLRPDLRVVASAATAAIIKGMQDTSRVTVDGEAAYINPRTPNQEGILEGDRNRYILRPYHLFHGKLHSWSQRSPAKKKTLEGSRWSTVNFPLTLDSFEVEAYPVDHSIPGAQAYAIKTPAGLVVYTGDLRGHGRWSDKTEESLKSLEKRRGEIFLLIIEGTRLGRSGKTYTEAEVEDAIYREVVQHAGSPVAVDFAPRNLERLLSCLRVAEEVERKLVITPKDAYILWGLAEAEPNPWSQVLSKVLVLQEARSRQEAWEYQLWQELKPRPVTTDEIAKDPGQYLLAFGFYEVNRLLDIRLKERALGRKTRRGIYIFSNAYWADQEQILDLKVLLQWLKSLDFYLLPEALATIPDPDLLDNPFHTSGHAPEELLGQIAERLKPSLLLPVHTENPQRWKHLGHDGVVL